MFTGVARRDAAAGLAPTRRSMVSGAVLVAVVAGVFVAAALASTASWPTATELSVASDATYANLAGVACAGVGACEAVGDYGAPAQSQVAFAATESGGSWSSTLTTIPPPSGAAVGSTVTVSAVSCTGGACVASGTYGNGTTGALPMVASESNGVWTPAAITLPSDAASGGNQNATLAAVDCTAATTCVAVGSYTNAETTNQVAYDDAMVAVETNGSWHPASEVTGLPSGAVPADSGGYAYLQGVTCPSTAACTAVGGYESGGSEAMGTEVIDPMVVELTDDVVESATGLTPPSTPGASQDYEIAHLDAIACTDPNDCAAVGDYKDTADKQQGLLATEQGGSWQPTAELTLPTTAEAARPDVQATGVACPAAGGCVIAGAYWDATANSLEAMVIDQQAGAWQPGAEVSSPSSGANPEASFASLACPAAGSCVGVGSYEDSGGIGHALVDTGSGVATGPPSTTTTTSPSPGPTTVSYPLKLKVDGSTASAFYGTLSTTGTLFGTISLTTPTAMQSPRFSYVPGDVNNVTSGQANLVAPGLLEIANARQFVDVQPLSGLSWVNKQPAPLFQYDTTLGNNGPDATTTSSLPLSLVGAGAPTLANDTLTLPLGGTDTSWTYSADIGAGDRVAASYTADLSQDYILGPGDFGSLRQSGETAQEVCGDLSFNIPPEIDNETATNGADGTSDPEYNRVCKEIEADWGSLTGGAGGGVANALVASAGRTFDTLALHPQKVTSASVLSPAPKVTFGASVAPLNKSALHGLSAELLSGAAATAAKTSLLPLPTGAKTTPLVVSHRFPTTGGRVTVLAGRLAGREVQLILLGPGYGATRVLRVHDSLAGATIELPHGKHTGRWYLGIVDYHHVHIANHKPRGTALLEAATWNVR